MVMIAPVLIGNIGKEMEESSKIKPTKSLMLKLQSNALLKSKKLK